MAQHIEELKQGCTIEKPVYNFHLFTRENYTETVGPNKIIIVGDYLLLLLFLMFLIFAI